VLFSHVSGSEVQNSLKIFNRIILVCFAALMFIFSIFSVVGYTAYGRLTSSNILLDLPTSQYCLVCRLSAAVAVREVYPIIKEPLVPSLRCLEFAKGRQEVMVNMVRLCMVLGSGAMALMASDLGSLNTMNGAFSCGAFVAFCSCVVGLHQLGPKSERPAWRFAMHILAVLGTVVSLLGMVVQDNGAATTVMLCLWRSHSMHRASFT